MVTLQMGAKKIRYNIRQTNPYKSKMDVDSVHPWVPVIYMSSHLYVYMIGKDIIIGVVMRKLVNIISLSTGSFSMGMLFYS